jgi:cyclophilin family peptidyl-prolyl cis-trans isomerase
VFGKVTSGIEVLDSMEVVPVNAGNRPKQKIVIEKVVVYKDAFQEYKNRKAKREQDEKEADVEKMKRREKREAMLAEDELGKSSKIGKYM